MEWYEVVWNFANSPMGVSAVVAILVWSLNKLYAYKPGWEQHEGVIKAGIKYVEKNVTEGSKLDEALDYIIKILEARGVKVDEKKKLELVEGINLVHHELEVNNQLKK